MNYNRFVNTDCSFLELSTIPTNQDCGATPRLSEISTIIILPYGAKGPADWTDYDDITGVIDNSANDNQYAKIVVGRGEIAEGQPVNYQLGRHTKTVGYRKTLRFELPIMYDQHYALLQKLQRGATSYRFWFGTLGGRLIGGTNGIQPDYSTGDYAYLAETDSVETGIINIGWYEDGAAHRTNHAQLLTTPDFTGESGSGVIGSVMYYYQKFTTGPTLTWTENSGGLPGSNTTAQVMVFQNGQKLIEGTSYTLTRDSAPGESTITIDSSVHWTGSIYEVITIETA